MLGLIKNTQNVCVLLKEHNNINVKQEYKRIGHYSNMKVQFGEQGNSYQPGD